jgi:NitT/TauT family transport system substrate-binding protein
VSAGLRWGPPLLATHGCSLSNAVLFVAEALDLFASEGIAVRVPRFRSMDSPAALLAKGEAGLGTVAFTQPFLARSLADRPVIVAGSGRRGVSVVAPSDITDAADLSGQPIGTFPGDPLQLLIHDLFAAHGLGPVNEVRYDTIEDATRDFTAGRLAALTIVEPYATRLRDGGAREISDGTDVWGPDFPDTVLVAAASLLAEQPETVRGAIRALRRAEVLLATEPVASLEGAVVHFPGFSAAELAGALPRMPPGTDIRHLEPTITDRWPRLAALGLVGGERPTRAPVSWGALEDVIAEENQAGQPQADLCRTGNTQPSDASERREGI